MIIKDRQPRGVIFVSLLAVMVVVAMLTGAFLKRSQAGLFRASHYRDGVRAEQAARGGANHVLALLEADPGYNLPLTGNLNGATYAVTFDPSQLNFSVNNLGNDAAATQTSFQGHQVAPRSADIIVVGSYGLSRRVIRVVAQQGVSSLRSVAAIGRVSLSGDVVVDGVKSLTARPGQPAPDPAPGGIFSKHRTDVATEPAIGWSAGTTFTLSSLSRLETAPAQTGMDSLSSNLRTLFPNQIVDQGAADTIPDIDVAARVTAGLGDPTVTPLAPGGSTMGGYVFINEGRSVDGHLTVNGDLVLSEGTLYVDGDLTINGGIEGVGTIYVGGDVTVRGGNTIVQTSQPAGMAMMAGGDINIEGLDAYAYLLALAAANPGVRDALDLTSPPLGLRQHLANYAMTDPNATALYLRARALSKHVNTAVSTPIWVNPIPGPSGGHVVATTDGAIPRLIMAIKATGAHLVPGGGPKVVQALEEMAFHFRDNDNSLPPFVAPGGAVDYSLNDDYTLNDTVGLMSPGQVAALRDGPLGIDWDDSVLPQESRTHSSIAYGVPAVPYGLKNQLSGLRRDAYLLYNPLDFSWLGDSTLQGMMYARGNINADSNFKIVGALISLGDVNLTNGATLIFNEEYRNLFGQLLPIGMVHFEEL